MFFYCESLSSLIFTRNIEIAFRLPGLEIPIITPPLFITVDDYLMYSFNSSRISQNIMDIFGNISNFNNNELFQYIN